MGPNPETNNRHKIPIDIIITTSEYLNLKKMIIRS